jgi:hypothetical protein
MKKEIRKLIRQYRRLGWTISVAGSGHIRWASPQGRVVVSSATPSCSFALKKIEHELSSNGRDWVNGFQPRRRTHKRQSTQSRAY